MVTSLPLSLDIVSQYKSLSLRCEVSAFTEMTYRVYFFSQRVINRWNSLSQEDVDASSSINCFKNRLDKRRTRQMDFFKDT